jgi:signal transduction histidine kinase
MQQTWKWLNGRVVTGTFIRLDKVIPGMSGVLGCMNDITDQEERLHEAERRRIEAEESKRQQELLVDFTSHEIRTPVSAILQCSSLVKENLQALKEQLQQAMAFENRTGFVPTPELMANLDEDVEALESEFSSLAV